MQVVLIGIYSLAAIGLAIYGLNYFVTVALWRNRRAQIPSPARVDSPRVTVQLPIYNEQYVVERLMDAAAALEWDRARLQIQVLDDSDDITSALAHTRAEYHRRRGIDIQIIRRADRAGYKAGALAAGLETARGEFIAVFDADFVPPKNFLNQTLAHFSAQPNLGMVQTRWSHLNADYSALTRAQAIALDGHFVIEQSARSENNLLLNFNGSGGVWRRACIEDAGGWQADTLSEDLDLSYRAQMRGWKFLFLPAVTAPAEIPPQIHAFKRQQFRWAKGSTQCLMKHAARLVRARDLSRVKRAQGLLHLSGYLMNPLLLVVILALVPMLALGIQPPAPLIYFSLATLGPVTLYALSQRALYRDWRARVIYLPVLILLGIGMAWNNSLAVVEALTRQKNTFRRTPKFRVERGADAWATKAYALTIGWEVMGELGLGCYALVGGLLRARRWTARVATQFPVGNPVFIFVCGGIFLHRMSERGAWTVRTQVPSHKSKVADLHSFVTCNLQLVYIRGFIARAIASRSSTVKVCVDCPPTISLAYTRKSTRACSALITTPSV
ncbi:MAG: glycosyltransferase [Chloroflexi bacterium]|nr:glycosyltransferase [Chloroflexota bacterium]